MNRYRPTSATITAALLALVSVLCTALPLIGGAGGIPPLISAVVLGLLGLVAAFGFWTLKSGLLASDRCVRSTRSARLQVSLPRPRRH